MAKKQERTLETRQNIIEAAGRGFRKSGYGGLGIDGLAKEAGVTSGAFYGHFKSKDDVFRETVAQGLADYRDAIGQMQQEHGSKWIQAFLDYYLGEKHCHNIEGGCAVPGLSADVMRSDKKTKTVYTEKIQEIASAIAQGLSGKDKKTAYALMALLGGAVMMERSVSDPILAREIANAIYGVTSRLLSED